ncbi:TadE/TadG family type IV pilus assembly protein [Lichenibacterium ramalinae]|uniref:TadE/TadG family type IV pilus assembly protein n=1 Tax=Lichenibacterium ramalinae TaxID=2316527 RepID=UPI0013EAB43D|nr:TadE/TadG family type IV pilus assembly protein [Lichenibacterium ramalinae]
MEFAILGLVFTMLLCFVVEIGMTMLMQSTLNEAAQAASRLIRTGSVQQAGGQPAPFQAALCAKVKLLMDCAQVRYDVIAGDRFATLPIGVQTDADSQLVNTRFVPGSAGQNVVVQVGYTRSLYFPILKDVMGHHGNLLILSTVVFQNEPY